MNKHLSIVICLIAFLTFFAVFCVPAFAVNSAYLQQEKWKNNSNVVVQSVNSTSMGRNLNGSFKYFYDSSANEFYVNFAVTESTLTNENNDVRVNFTFITDSESYTFSVDENGLMESDESSNFTVEQNFSVDDEVGQYVVGVGLTKSLKNSTVQIRLYVNGCNYLINKGIYIKTDESTTAKSTTTKANKTTTTRATKSTTTTKFTTYPTTVAVAKNSKTTVRNSTVTTAKTTVKTAHGATTKSSQIVTTMPTTTESSKYSSVTYDGIATTLAQDEQQVYKYSTSTKIVIALGLAIAGVGLICALIGIGKALKKLINLSNDLETSQDDLEVIENDDEPEEE